MKKQFLILLLLLPFVVKAQSTSDTSFCGYSRTTSAPITAVSGQTYDKLYINVNGANQNGINVPNGSHDIVIKHCFITNAHAASGGIHIGINCTNITVEYNFISASYRGVNIVGTGFSPAQPGTNIKIIYNRFYNIADAVGHPNGGGSSVQFNNIIGSGLVCSHNDVLTDIQSADVGDVLNFYQSSGTSTSPMHLDSNCVQGGSLDPGGKSGFILGDVGGAYQTATGNKCYNSGMQGFQIQGGHDITATANFVYGNGVGVALVGITYGNYSGQPSYNITESFNRISWKKASGGSYFAKWWDTSNGTTQPNGWATNTADFSADPGITASLLPIPLFNPTCTTPPTSSPVISYIGSPYNFVAGTTIGALSPSNSGGAATSWSVSPALPSGLVISPSTGVISGTPTSQSPVTIYTISASNSGGTGKTNITITVAPTPPLLPAFTYSPSANVYTLGSGAISPLNPISTGGPITSFSVSPALPTSLSLNTVSGQISGTPTATSPSTNYVITGTNASGSGTANLNLTILPNPVQPPNISYSPATMSMTYGVPITSWMPTNTGSIATYSISPALVAGLAFDSNTGAITGFPAVVQNPQNYVVTATNANGVSHFTISISSSQHHLTITALSTQKYQGSVNPSLLVDYSGFIQGDTYLNQLSTQPTVTTTALTNSPIGAYPISASGAVSTNYAISYANGILNVILPATTIIFRVFGGITN